MKILLIDNYDSFTYNLVHYLESFEVSVEVVRNDEIVLSQFEEFDAFVISPGPGLPEESGKLMEAIDAISHDKPILGVCLGFQALVMHFGGTLYNQNQVKHGVGELCELDNRALLFRQLPSEISVGLYHSWCASELSFPEILLQTARSKAGVIMAFEHRSRPVYGVQFHPESVLTEYGKEMVQNFIRSISPGNL